MATISSWQLAAALIAQHGVAAAAAAVPPAPPEPIAKYGGDRMDVERMDSHVANSLADKQLRRYERYGSSECQAVHGSCLQRLQGQDRII